MGSAHFVAGVGTGGTITGVGSYLKGRRSDVLVVGVDPVGSIYTAGSDEEVPPVPDRGRRRGLLAGDVRPWRRRPVRDVEDGEAFTTTRRLAATEGLLVGGSGGMAVAGAVRVAEAHPDLLTVVLVPDGGRNYLSKIFDDTWMKDNGFET